MNALALFPEHSAPTADPTIADRNRRLTPSIILQAPLDLMGRTGWDLDAAAERGGSASNIFINADLDALSPRPWSSYLGLSATPSTPPCFQPNLPMVWLNPPFLDPFGDGQWKLRWVRRAIAESKRLIIWVLLPLAADEYGWELDQAADIVVDVAWRVRFKSPCGLEENAPMAHRHRLWRLVPPGWRDVNTRRRHFTLRSDKHQHTAVLRSMSGAVEMTINARREG